MNFPDLPHFRKLQKDLWQWPRSRAAIMVGAGFSLNAEPLPGVRTHFPTWRDLVWAMFEEMHSPQPGETPAQAKRREDKFNSTSPLRIASEYEATFGRSKLDEVIRSLTPDSHHRPGKLHSLLLQLPWVDVFTTNYDTLLERTEIFERKYHLVTKASELTTTFSPRIIKLHGSFPSQTPFIVTEEDYRLYPRSSAPFVNTVQQSLLENAFVLIGFSGDDPNFLEWTGWIRDELGDKHAPIYMVGPLYLGSAERSLLTRRSVTPIDLSPLFTGFSTPKGVHAPAIEWFLRSLWAARPVPRERWPRLDRGSMTVANGLPQLVEPELIIPNEVTSFPESRKPLAKEIVANVLARWRFERENYPGWVIAADSKRSSVFLKTEAWIDPLIRFAQDYPPSDRLILFREINWRLEMSMVPLFSNWIGPFQHAVDELFEDVAAGRAIQPSLEFLREKFSSSSTLADAWLEIAFGLLREARETYNDERWKVLKKQIDKIVEGHPQYFDRSQYEAALWQMWNVDRQSAKDILLRWRPEPRFPLAVIWKAGLLAELDELGEARTILRPALLELRRALGTQPQNIELLSLEGWCTYLLIAIESALDIRSWSTIRDEFRERLEELELTGCSPWPLKESFEAKIKAPPPKRPKLEQRVYGFDPGQITLSRQLGGNSIEPYLPGFAYIRHFEQASVPLRLGRINMADLLKNACSWIAPFIPFWSPALLIRAGKHQDLIKGDFLTRTQVAAMEPALAKRLYDWCLRILEREITNLPDRMTRDSAQESLLEVLSETLSRLALKVERQDHGKTFPLLLKFYEYPSVWSHISLRDCCLRWFARLFETADSETLIEWLPKLIRLPYFDSSAPDGWRDPIRLLPTGVGREVKGRLDSMPLVKDAIDWLILRVGYESGALRNAAITRLNHLYYCGLMTSEEEQKLGDLLWNNCAGNHLPDGTGLWAHGLLRIPSPKAIDVQFRVKNHILSLTPQFVVSQDANGRVSMSASRGWEQPLILEASSSSKPIIELTGEVDGTLEWTPAESKQLYSKARAWWLNDKNAFELEKKVDPFGVADSLRNAFRKLGDFLARAVIPQMKDSNDADWDELFDWLQELRAIDASPTVALPYILLHRPNEAENFEKLITADLNADTDGIVAAAAKAIRHWIQLAALDRIPKPAPTLMMALIERVVFRRKAAVVACLNQLAYLIIERPEALTASQAELLTASLIPWHHATILPMPDDTIGDFPEAERPALRVFVARLASALQIWHTKVAPEVSEPPPIKLWNESCASDPLPEIRRAFNAWTEFQKEIS